jgi:hypothetical protein
MPPWDIFELQIQEHRDGVGAAAKKHLGRE